jgi:hypothetical protein
MKTSNFIKTCVSALLLLVASASNALPLLPYGPDGPINEVYRGPGGWALSVQCKHNGAPDDCVISATKDGRVTKVISKTSVLPGVQWYSDIAMMRFRCGSGCRRDLFFSPPDKIDGHELVAQDAINTKRRLVVSVASNPLRVFKLFGGKEPVATLRLATLHTQPDLESVRWERNRLDVWYRDDTGKLKRASVEIPASR